MKAYLITLAVCAFLSATAIAQPAEQPNVMLILTDDIGWGDPRCYNPDSKIPTRNIDRLAEMGMRFTHAHTPAALCAPTRYSMLTGNYAWRGRSPGGTWGFNVPSQMRHGQKTVAELLRPAGYRTAMFGKAGTGGYWAFDADSPRKKLLAPIAWGFDYSYLIPRGHQARPHAFFENGVAAGDVVGKGAFAKAADWDASKVGQRLLDKAIAFLDDWAERNKQSGKPQPFFIHFCTDGAHGPYAPAERLAGVPLKGVTKMTDHTDMVYETDILTGKLVEALEQRDLLESTLIVYTSDNGGIPVEREYEHDAVARLRGIKSTIFEGGQRVPFVVCWPGKVPAGTVRHQVIGTHDVVATALELAGAAGHEGQAIDSVSLVPVLLGKRDDTEPVRDALLVQSSPGRGPFVDKGFRAGQPAPAKIAKTKGGKAMAFALYQGDWKLVIAGGEERAAALYDLNEDLGEEQNLIERSDHRERVKRMTEMYHAIRASRGRR